MLKKYNWTSSAQVALAYVAQRGLGVVTKSDNPQYLAEDLDLFAPQHIIDAADRAKLDAVTSVTCSLEAPGGCCH
jgi:diketogulonate reductase-like aldo/keto reductase